MYRKRAERIQEMEDRIRSLERRYKTGRGKLSFGNRCAFPSFLPLVCPEARESVFYLQFSSHFSSKQKHGRGAMATADTKRWRKARKTVPRDLSPLPESIPTPYKRVRAPDERAACCQDLLDRLHDKAAAEGRVITPNLKAHR